MTTSSFLVRKVAVLGAGVMGAQIAAHLVNANVATVLFDLSAKEGDPNGVVLKAIQGLTKLEPAPLATKDRAGYIDAANYDQHLAQLAECDLVIEAIAERLDWKQALYEKVAPHLGAGAIFASNTSGLSINALAEACPASMRARFCGVHFFNPPRYMHLVELIPGRTTDPRVLDQLECFLTTTLGKGVIRAKDTPNFVANRVGIFSMLATMHHTEAFGLGFDLVDALTGPAIGRAKSATYRTADVVGLDTMAHVIKTMHDSLSGDPWHRYYQSPAWLAGLIEKGALGQKTKAGIFRKLGKEIQVLDLAARDYRPSGGKLDPEVAELLKLRNPAEKFAKLRAASHPQAQFLWAIFRDLFHYCAVHLGDIAHNARDLDLAIRWGFGWAMGPFETWQAAGWQQVAGWIKDDIVAGKAMSAAPLPAWVTDGRNGVHTPQGAYCASTNTVQGRSTLPVYQRQYFPDPVLGEKWDGGQTISENDAVRLWHTGDEIAILSFKSKMNVVGDDVLDGILAAIDEAEKNWAALVLWQTKEPFSAGANLASLRPVLEAGRFDLLEAVVAKFQHTAQRLKYSLVPTVAAVRGLALGGGCEFQMHCDRTVAALESYIGLVEVGVGLLPAGGGCKEFALRAMQEARGGDIFPGIRNAFQAIAMARVSKSALEAKEIGYLRPSDLVVFNSHELLHVAKAQARALAEAGYRPPLPTRAITAAGKGGLARLQMMLVNMRDGGFISAYDFEIGNRVAKVLCGGEIETGSSVDERWLIELERAEFVDLLRREKTQARIAHMLETGKPLRN
ncbi:MAG: 3-hydroxyacyl-CoA dehydrogenase/enoyl-CoA hydratase family protein [Betaproteobacteria bacterium]|nr:3-hydroxyacyl-CoA dehydrogenase/enoyl-CoA hydratase family protein [Betaproteobacteria bacterium]